MFVHANMLQSALPVSCTSGVHGADHHNNIKMEHHDSFNNTESVEKAKNRNDGNDTGEKDKKIRRHACDLCYKRFTQAGALKTHMLTHTGYKPFVCVQCGKAFSLACNLKRHELLHTGEKPFLCDICSKAFTRASHLKGHKRIHTGERPYKCPHCQADFNQSNHVRKHVKKVHGGDGVSELAFPAGNDSERCKRIQSGEQVNVCADAGNRCAGSSYLQNQSMIPTEKRLPPAMATSPTTVPSTKILSGAANTGESKRNVETSREEELLQSLIRRKRISQRGTPVGPRDDEIIYCEECDAESMGDCPQHSHFQKRRNPASLSASNPPHQSSSVEGTSRPKESANRGGSLLCLEKNHLCQLCSSAFVLFNSLKLHMMCIHGEKVRAVVAVPSLAEHCDVADHEDEDVQDCDDLNKEHDNVESVEETNGEVDSLDSSSKRRKRKTYRQTCDVCFKSFTDLRTHKLTHTGYKQFECGTCNKSFTHACNLKAHELTHTGQKPFVCDMCGKAFTRDCHLKAHKRIHTGERPYKCPHCDADFNQSNHVQKHIRTVHSGNRRFVCRFCGGNFSRTTDLHKHTKIHLRGKKSLQFRFPKEQVSVSSTAEDLMHSDPLSSDQDL